MSVSTSDFSAYLAPREVIRWSGVPQQGLAFRGADLFLVPFSLLWCGFAVFWEVTVWSSGAPSFFMLWGAMFVCVGLYFVFGRFIWDAFIRSRTKYALTDQRALILGGWQGNELTEVDLKSTSEIRYQNLSGSRGTISFGPDLGFGRGGAVWHTSSKGQPQFFKTEDAAGAYRIIQSARAQRT